MKIPHDHTEYMKLGIKKIIRVYKLMVSQIAFIPTVMALGALVLAIVMLYIERNNYADWLTENIDFALVQGTENARMILTTIIGGVLSLTVFSFSMVMVVLNRTSASLSPRVLPELVAQKSHQLVLGYYMGTIVYSLILIINVNKESGIPSFSILISMLATIGALGLFIYFIHSISRSIQVGNILHKIFKETLNQIERFSENVKPELDANIEWYPFVIAKKPGFYYFLESDNFLDFLEDHSLSIKISNYPEKFTLAGETLVEISANINDKDGKESCEDCFELTERPPISGNFVSGIQKISEIAIKALSPGINDPGTAIRSLNILTIILTKLMPYSNHYVESYKDGKIKVIKTSPPLSAILHDYISPILNYGSGQLIVVMALFDLYGSLLHISDPESKVVINTFAESLIEDCEKQQYLKVESAQIKRRILELDI